MRPGGSALWRKRAFALPQRVNALVRSSELSKPYSLDSPVEFSQTWGGVHCATGEPDTGKKPDATTTGTIVNPAFGAGFSFGIRDLPRKRALSPANPLIPGRG